MRILLVGKDDVQARLIHSALTASTAPAFDVEHASTAWDAQRKATDGQYDALVLDDRLSDSDCETLLGRLRAGGMHVPALLLTSAGSEQMAPTAVQASVDALLPRTDASNGPGLVRAVVGMLQRHRLSSELADARDQYARTAAVLAGLTHDLATPLGVIAGMAQMLLDDDYGLNQDGRLCAEDVLQAATTAVGLLTGVRGAGVAPSHSPAVEAPEGPPATPTPGRKMVLIADDDDATRRLVSLTLASDRYSVLQAADGKEAWRMIRDHHPAVAILDWQMPIYSGLELTDVIKSDPQVWGMTVIMLTGRTTAADRQAGAQARADLYLTKPFSPQELLAAVEQALGIS